jgi:MATE family multidrug resistance protein
MRAPLLVTLATNALHLGLDLVLMFQMGMGIRGAAISTAASEWLAAGAYCWLVWQRRDVLALWPPPKVPVNEIRRRLLPFLQAGTAVVMRTGSLLGTKTLATAVAARLGPGSVASHQVLMQLWVLSSMLVDSLAVSGQTLIAVNLGKGEAGTARQISERLLQLGLGLGVGMAVLSGVSATWWPHLFTTGTPGSCEHGFVSMRHMEAWRQLGIVWFLSAWFSW